MIRWLLIKLGDSGGFRLFYCFFSGILMCCTSEIVKRGFPTQLYCQSRDRVSYFKVTVFIAVHWNWALIIMLHTEQLAQVFLISVYGLWLAVNTAMPHTGSTGINVGVKKACVSVHTGGCVSSDYVSLCSVPHVLGQRGRGCLGSFDFVLWCLS